MKKFNVGDLVEISTSGKQAKFNGLRLFVVGYETVPVLSFDVEAWGAYKSVYDICSATDNHATRENLINVLRAICQKFILFKEDNLTLIRPANSTKE